MSILVEGMTFREIKSRLRAIHRMTIGKRDGEYRVNFIGGAEPTAYYTPDLKDAYHTAIIKRYAQG
jgi:hypothetical protein